MRATYIRRRQVAASGSAGKTQKPWVFEKYMSFLGDILEPSTTISNVPEDDEKEKEVGAMGFNRLEKSNPDSE